MKPYSLDLRSRVILNYLNVTRSCRKTASNSVTADSGAFISALTLGGNGVVTNGANTADIMQVAVLENDLKR